MHEILVPSRFELTMWLITTPIVLIAVLFGIGFAYSGNRFYERFFSGGGAFGRTAFGVRFKPTLLKAAICIVLLDALLVMVLGGISTLEEDTARTVSSMLISIWRPLAVMLPAAVGSQACMPGLARWIPMVWLVALVNGWATPAVVWMTSSPA